MTKLIKAIFSKHIKSWYSGGETWFPYCVMISVVILTSQTSAWWGPESCWAPLWFGWGGGGRQVESRTAGSARPLEHGWEGRGTSGRRAKEAPCSLQVRRSRASLEVEEEIIWLTCRAASLGRHLHREGGSERIRCAHVSHVQIWACIKTTLPVMWLGSLLKGLGGSAGGCLCSIGGLESVDSVLSAGYTLDFFLGGAWMDFWVWSWWHAPSLGIWKSREPEEKKRWDENIQIPQHELRNEASTVPTLCCLPTAAAAPSISSVPSHSDRLEPSTGERPFSILTSSRTAGQEPSIQAEWWDEQEEERQK